MKNIFLSALFLGIVLSVFGQGADASVRNLMASVSKNYKSKPTIKAQFNVAGKDASGQTVYRSEGMLWMEPKSGRYNMDMEDRQLISDGKVLYTVLKEEEEIQMSDLLEGEQGLNPANLFTFYDKGYRYSRAKSEKQGAVSLEVVDFVPTQSSASVKKIRLRINPKTNLIYDGTLFDTNGGQYTYTVKSFSGEAKAPAGAFSVSQPAFANFEKVDLR